MGLRHENPKQDEAESELVTASVFLHVINRELIIHEEKETYTANKLQADLGGSAGLVLGLNITFLGDRFAICSPYYRPYHMVHMIRTKIKAEKKRVENQ